MGTETKIEWADDTVNFWWGCVKVSAGCANCYAEALDARFRLGGETHWGPSAPRYHRHDAAVRDLEKAARKAVRTGERRRVFIQSMADFFEARPDLDQPRIDALREMRRLQREHRIGGGPALHLLLTTKRPEVAARYAGMWPEEAMLIVSVEDQSAADKRIPVALQVGVPVGLSCEPMLGPVDLSRWMRPWLGCGYCGESYPLAEGLPSKRGPAHRCARCGRPGCMLSLQGDDERGRWQSGERYDLDSEAGVADRDGTRGSISWVIVGGESGWRARPMHPAWARSLRDQCQEARVPFFFKQWGAWGEPDSIEMTGLIPPGYYKQDPRDGGAPRHDITGDTTVYRVGKKAAGRRLDWLTWDEVPT